MSLCVCVRQRERGTDLPGAETLEEEVQREAPHHGREEDTHQREALDPLTASQLHEYTPKK